MPSIIVRPDLPMDLYPLKAVVRVSRTATPAQLNRAIREQGATFVRYVAKDGYEYQDSYGMKLLGGPFPVLRAKPLPKAKDHARLPKGPHERGLDMVDRSFLVDVVPIHIADEVEYLIGGLFLHRQIQTEMLDTDIAALTAKRMTNGRN